MRDEITITLNQRTIMEAVQSYLDKHFTPPMRLTKFVPTATYDPITYTATMNEIVAEVAPEQPNTSSEAA